MKSKDLEGKIGEEVVYDTGGRWDHPAIVTFVGFAPKGTVYLRSSYGKNSVAYANIRFNGGYTKAVPLAHISNTTPEEFLAEEAAREAATESLNEYRRLKKARTMAIEDRLVELGVIKRATSYDYEKGENVPSSRLKYADTLNLELHELEKLIALIPEGANA